MSAIGITAIEDGKIVEEFYSLVNPAQEFDYFNMCLTGITPEAVEDKPEFDGIWSSIEPIMSSGLLIAHNAPFDMGVLAKCMRDYGIFWDFQKNYACTCSIGRKYIKGIPDHKLDTMCEYLGIELDHHNAGSDARACAQLMLFYLDNGFDIGRFTRSYDLENIRSAGAARC